MGRRGERSVLQLEEKGCGKRKRCAVKVLERGKECHTVEQKGLAMQLGGVMADGLGKGFPLHLLNRASMAEKKVASILVLVVEG